VLIEPGTTLADLYDSRFPLYELYAELKIEASQLSPEEVVSRICEQLSL